MNRVNRHSSKIHINAVLERILTKANYHKLNIQRQIVFL